MEENDWPNCTNPTDLDTWPTKREVMERLDLSEKTIERRITDGTLTKRFRIIPGRKPLPILHPQKVKELLMTKLEPTAEVVKSVSSIVKKPRDEMTLSPTLLTDIAQTVIAHAVTELSVSSLWALQHKFYLTLDEAVLLSGLPEKFLLKRLQNGVIPAIKSGGWRIRRVDLERYNAITDRLMPVDGNETGSLMTSSRHASNGCK